MNNLISILCGFLFGAGLLISGMTDPSVIISFLDVSRIQAGQWNPSLLYVMVGALAVYSPMYALLVKKRISSGNPPAYASKYCLPEVKKIDRPLIIGAAFFGLGWGVLGICPGPSIVSIPLGSSTIAWFVTSMLSGIYLVSWMKKRHSSLACIDT